MGVACSQSFLTQVIRSAVISLILKMAGYRYTAAALSLLSVASASAFPEYPKCIPTTTTVYTTITVPDGGKSTPVAPAEVPYQNKPDPSWSVPGVTFPTYSPEKPN